MKPPLSFTGVPFLDIGAALILAYTNKSDLDEVTETELENLANFALHRYPFSPYKDFLALAFTRNAWFDQNAYNAERKSLSDEKRLQAEQKRSELGKKHLLQWQHEIFHNESWERCIFTGEPILSEPLSQHLRAGYIARTHMPLLQGDRAINFFPNGQPGLPISAGALLTLQLFPLGCVRCCGSLLAVHTNNTPFLIRLIRLIWRENQRMLFTEQQALEEERKKDQGETRAKTLLIETLSKCQRLSQAEEPHQPTTITAYYLNNSGKRGEVFLYHLPSEMVRFLQDVEKDTYRTAWYGLVHRNWYLPRSPKNQQKDDAPVKKTVRTNLLYEDLFTLPHDIARFVRRYFLPVPRLEGALGDPHRSYSSRDIPDWPLIELFLRKVAHMDPTRLALISHLGDGLADYTRQAGGKRFFREFYTGKTPQAIRETLIRANLAQMKEGRPALFDLPTYTQIFEIDQDYGRPDAREARDLILIRMMDQLRKHPEILEAISEEHEEKEARLELEDEDEHDTSKAFSSAEDDIRR